LIREQIRHDEIPRVIRDLYYVEKFARAVLVRRIIELQMMIGGATATSWLSASHAPDIRERKEVEKSTLTILRRHLCNESVGAGMATVLEIPLREDAVFLLPVFSNASDMDRVGDDKDPTPMTS
jgi:hypothetical protein